MKVKDAVSIISLAATIILSLTTIWLGYLVYNLQANSMRADVSILINPLLDQHWAFVFDGVYFTVNGTFSNDGTRAALIKELDLSVLYNLSDNNVYSLTTTFLNPSEACQWNNDTILAGEARRFSVTMFVNEYMVVDVPHNSSRMIGNSRSDAASIYIQYNDGKGDKPNTMDFNTH